jgi:hypothetical protein
VRLNVRKIGDYHGQVVNDPVCETDGTGSNSVGVRTTIYFQVTAVCLFKLVYNLLYLSVI